MDEITAKLLDGYPVVDSTVVDWGDMDAFKHVNNVAFFRYFENARVAYGEKIGIIDRMETEGVGPILAWTDCKYIRPVVFPDTVYIGMRLTKLEGSEMRLEYKMVSQAQQAVVAMGNSLGVFYDYRNSRRMDFPESMVAGVEKIEGKTIAEINNS